jgi:uncharacterized protein YaiI (UPF0178 family)
MTELTPPSCRLTKFEKRLEVILTEYPGVDRSSVITVLRSQPQATDEQVALLSKTDDQVVKAMIQATQTALMRQKEAIRQRGYQYNLINLPLEVL